MHHWHLSFLLFRPGVPNPTAVALPSCRLHYLTLSKPGQPHQKHTALTEVTRTTARSRFSMLLVELVGIEPTSNMPSIRRDYNHQISSNTTLSMLSGIKVR